MSNASNNPFDASRLQDLIGKAGEELLGTARRIDAWAAENPYEASILGGAVGLATALAFNKLIALKGALALADCAYGTIKGAAVGYAYPKVRTRAAEGFAQASEGFTKTQEAAGRAAGDLYRYARRAYSEASQAAKAVLG